MRAIDVHIEHPADGGHARAVPCGDEEVLPRQDAGRTEEEMAGTSARSSRSGRGGCGDRDRRAGLQQRLRRRAGKEVAGCLCRRLRFGRSWKETLIAEAERCVRELGMMGHKFAPNMQAFERPPFLSAVKTISGLGVPIQLHTGTTGLGAGMPGGAGIKLDHNRPIPYIDDVAADFPLDHRLSTGLAFRRRCWRSCCQGQRVLRAVGLDAEVLPGVAGPRGQRPAAGQGACSAPLRRSIRARLRSSRSATSQVVRRYSVRMPKRVLQLDADGRRTGGKR